MKDLSLHWQQRVTRRRLPGATDENNTTWAPATTNQAGDIELQTTGEIMCGVRVKGSALILTTLDAHSATYAGPPFVYSFNRVGTACGIISRQSAIAVDDGAFWMGTAGFFQYNGASVQEMRVAMC